VRVGKSYSTVSPELQSPRAQPNLSPANSFSAWARFPAQGGCEAGGLDPSQIHRTHTTTHFPGRHTHTHSLSLTHTHTLSHFLSLSQTHTHISNLICQKYCLSHSTPLHSTPHSLSH